MTTKLTLTIDNTVISSAKKYANSNGKSLSSLVENYLKSLSNKKTTDIEIAPRIKKLMSIVTLPSDFDYKQELSKALQKKHIK